MVASTTSIPQLTAEQVQKVLVQPLQDASVFLAAGPRVFDTAGPIRIPKAPVGDDSKLTWVGENEQIPEADYQVSELELMPSTMKSVKVLTRYSNELSRQSFVSLDQVLKDRLVADVANKIDLQLLSASGDGITTPKGLFAYAGTQTVDAAGPMSLDVLLDAWGKALAANVNMAALKWLVTPGDFVKLRKLKDGQQRYLLQPDPTADAVFRLFGSPVIVTGRIPDTTGSTPTGRAALVDFSQIAVARDLAPSVTILSERYADYDQQAIRVVTRYDAAPINPQAVVTIGGITR